MNNILDFSQYKEKVRLYEANLVKEQIMEPIEEGLRKKIREKINQKASVFVKQALADEIEMGEKLNEEITKSIEELKGYVQKIQQEVDDSDEKKGEFFTKLKKIFDDIDKASFSLMTLLGGVEINFADFVANATMANMVNFGVLFIPTRNLFLLKKSYKYFIGIVKNTIRRDLLMLWLNFDQFENTVLIQSLDDDVINKAEEIKQEKLKLLSSITVEFIGTDNIKGVLKGPKDKNEAKKLLDMYGKQIKIEQDINKTANGSSMIGMDRYDNTYTKTLDQLKNFVLEDDGKYLDAIKRGMLELAIDEIDTKSYVNLLIDAAEECAFEVSNAIHNNFLSMVSVFKLSNQKRLIELVKKDNELFEKQKQEAENERQKLLDEDKMKEKEELINKKGKEIFDKVTEKPEGKDQVEKYEDLNEEAKTDDGKEYSEKDVLLGWFQIENGKNWKENEDKVSDLLKLHLFELHNEFDKKYDLNNASYLSYLPIINYLKEFVIYREEKSIKSEEAAKSESSSSERGLTKSGPKSKDTKNTSEKNKKTYGDSHKVPDGFSLTDGAQESVVKKFKKLLLEYSETSDDFSKDIKDDKKVLLKEVVKLMKENIFKISSSFDEDDFYKTIEELILKEKITYNEETMTKKLSQIKKIEDFLNDVESEDKEEKEVKE